MKIYEDFFFNLSKEEQNIVSSLRSIVLDCSPAFKEKISYNVPYYSLHYRVCFIWPGSVKWGTKEKEGVAFGLCKGFLLSDEQGLLEKEGRKEVYLITIRSLKDIKEDAFREIIQEAILVDEEQYKLKVIRRKLKLDR